MFLVVVAWETGFLWMESPICAAASFVQVSQIQGDFPDTPEAGMEFAQNRRIFKGYKGQGHLLLQNEGVKQADVYINGRHLDITEALASGKKVTDVDIHAYTRDGYNTLKILNIQPEKAGLKVQIPYPELQYGRPEQSGVSSDKLKKVDEVIENDIKNGFPGAVLLVVKDGRIIKQGAYGWAKKYEQMVLLPESAREPMRTDTMFDLASNTKMYATIYALMKLTEEGRLSPEDFVSKYLPEYMGDGREKIKLRDIMTHSAGYEPVLSLHKPSSGEFYSLQREKSLHLLNKAPLTYPLGTKTVYSDTDYMLLASVIEKVTGERLDTYVENEIYKPLGLTHTLFNPLRKGFQPGDFAATEPCGNTRSGMVYFPGIRRATIQGEVQDEQTFYSMDGVSGHAGLFSRATDLAVLAQLLLNGGGYGNYKLCGQQTLTYFTKPTDRNPKFGLGWNKMYMPDRVWEFGPYASSQAVAHSGWVGTDICIDPQYDLAIILLTNRVHVPNVPGKLNTFITDDFPTISYGSILSLVYEAFLEK